VPKTVGLARDVARVAWKTIGVVSVLLGLFWALLELRQEISVDPHVAYDSSDPFKQRFVILNNGPLPIHDVHYTCSVTFTDPTIRPNHLIVMMPFTRDTSVIGWKEKTSTDCDFVMKLGTNLRAARIAINVFYKRWPSKTELHTPAFKFSALRDSTGAFTWEYGSPDTGPFDTDAISGSPRIVMLIPFIGQSQDPPASVLNAETTMLIEAGILNSHGYKVLTSEVLPENQYLKPPIQH
jgi:hypothetical protein